MGLVAHGSMDLGTHIWHPPQIFCRGGWHHKERDPGIEIGLGLLEPGARFSTVPLTSIGPDKYILKCFFSPITQ